MEKETTNCLASEEAVPVPSSSERGLGRLIGSLIAVLFLGGILFISALLPMTADGGHLEENLLVKSVPPCMFLHITGHPCPSCGMTRGFVALSHGDFWLAMRHHLMAPALYLLFVILLVSEILSLVTGGRIAFSPGKLSSIILTSAFVIGFFVAWMIKIFGNFCYPN